MTDLKVYHLRIYLKRSALRQKTWRALARFAKYKGGSENLILAEAQEDNVKHIEHHRDVERVEKLWTV